MIQITVGNNFESWRGAARELLQDGVEPADVIWQMGAQRALFDSTSDLEKRSPVHARVPSEFLNLAKAVTCYDDPEKWPLLYRILYRLVHETRHLLHVESDPDVRAARLMEKAVNRDVHKFHAFVRFRRIEVEGAEIFAAWHEPQHFTVERACPFFERRFGSMTFSILTPKGCAHWDKKQLTFSEPAARSSAPERDEMEDFWLLYYRSIFNPFRLKISAMKNELPMRHWPTLPEAVLIPELIRQARNLPN